MTKRAERVYLSFFEGKEPTDNQFRIAQVLEQVVDEILPDINDKPFTSWRLEVLRIAEELRDPHLLDDIYGELTPDELQ